MRWGIFFFLIRASFRKKKNQTDEDVDGWVYLTVESRGHRQDVLRFLLNLKCYHLCFLRVPSRFKMNKEKNVSFLLVNAYEQNLFCALLVNSTQLMVFLLIWFYDRNDQYFTWNGFKAPCFGTSYTFYGERFYLFIGNTSHFQPRNAFELADWRGLCVLASSILAWLTTTGTAARLCRLSATQAMKYPWV